MNLWKGILSCLLIFTAFGLRAQQTTVYTEANLAYHRGVDFYNQHIYGLAQKEFRSAIDLLRPVNEPEWEALKNDAELYYAKCAVRLDQPEAEKITLDFLRENAPAPIASQAALEIGDYYFEQKDYKEALSYYDMAPDGSSAAGEEIRFKKGYSYFVTKNFSRAKAELAPLKENARSEWYYPANYYYGCCSFFEEKYDDAARSFVRCEKSDKYKQVVPYYIAQIYANKKQYDQVISYGAMKAQDSGIRNRAELNQLVGQAYFEKGDYAKALPYLEYAATNGARLRPADYYQLGYSQYRNGYYKAAIDNFEQLGKQDSLLGQNGLYHLGDCYIRTGNKFNARTAFGQAANLNYDQTVKEDALINYAKLSYELKYDRDAINALQRFPAGSRYYEDAQALMSEVFLNTRDYDRAVSTLEGIKNRTPKLNATYQQVTYNRGVQLYQNGQKEEARRYFNKSLDQPIDKRTAALSSFWLGSIANETQEWNISKQHMMTFLNNARNINNLPEESSILMGQYVQGYNYLKLDDYKNALANFKACVEGIRRAGNQIQSDQIKKSILGDAVLRAGDCHFKTKKYADALAYYNEAVNKQYDGFEYALYQKAIIRGLQGSQVDKAVALESLVERYPNSRYADESLLELGNTYLEMGKLGEATIPLRKLVSDYRGRSPLINQALMQLGIISFRQGNYTAAANYYKQVFSNNPEASQARDALALLQETYQEMGRPDEYLAFLETVPGYKVSNNSRDSIIYQSAEYQYQNRKFQQAIDGFTNYLTKYPTGPNSLDAYYYRAESYSADEIRKFDMAFKDYAAVVSRGPSKFYPRAAEKAALLSLNYENNPASALEYARKWEESALSDASRFSAQLTALEAAYKSGNNSVAVNEYANKVNSSPMASVEQYAIANFYIGKMAFDRGDYARAYPALQSVAENSTTENMAESYHLMAQILYRQKKYEDAEDLIANKANKSSAGYDDWIARNLILLSDVYLDQGDRNSASAALEAVLENYNGRNQAVMDQARKKYEALGGTAAPAKTNQTTGKGSNLLELEEGG
ncbi:MAG: tetratricopeptide repeat protein [Saprospiraceae bacterium]|nr:tetratricopeptide repeat protein [Saprospiraceae bacterium]MCB0575253.1 tetratricopeptide repeat protein [Saprospiraceae bacterium]MCB9307151.1 tetratricopeptide repeat protein [Lewinellaceae bacterium]MCB9353864.1 tetratricopeptide repeat protein [Lewinellaceae bacterium]